jgi:hypothetical protein
MTEIQSKTGEFLENKIYTISISNVWDENKMKYLLDSAKKKNFTIDIIGLNRPFNFLSKIIYLREHLLMLPNNPIICFTDAYDVFYLDNLETIYDKFISFNSDIVWSVEKLYSHQLKGDLNFYESLQNTSDYKYINTGTFIGYKNSLLELLNDINLSIKDQQFLNELKKEGWELKSSAVDQTIISHHLVKNWEKYNIKFDYECVIFYIPCGDWDNIEQYVNKKVQLISNGSSPSIIHVCWKLKYEHILEKLFSWKYYYTEDLINKSYTWNNSKITFLDDEKMDAFGNGSYLFIDNNKIKANFGKKIHEITFNKDFTEYVSIRQNDNQIIKGYLIK